MKKKIYISSAFAFFLAMTVQAQEKDKNMGTEEVRVVKSYEATVGDAFKIKDTPLMDDEDNATKKDIKYSIYSFPVASTFAPEKGQAAAVDKDSLDLYFNNYALLGYGNYNTLRGELGIAEKVGENMYVGGLLNHISSQGGINALLVDDKYSKSNLDFTLGSKNLTNDWNLNFGVSQAKYNWYGLPDENYNFTVSDYENLDFEQKYNDAHVGMKFENYDGLFRGVGLNYKYFWDEYDSKESRFILTPKFNVELDRTTIKLDVKADYLNTEFADRLVNGAKNKYSYFIIAAEPSVEFSDENYSVQLGVGLSYINGTSNETNDNSFVVYPKIKANVDLVKNIVMAYAGAEGGVSNNSYADFAEINPYISPNLTLAPTKQQYNIYAGLKGKLYHNISYNVRASYISEDNKAMFVTNEINPTIQTKEVYMNGNSFGVMYDMVNTFNLFGELNLNFSEAVTIGISGEYNSYNADLNNVYNLPDAKVGAKIHADFTKQWYGGLSMYYVGQRTDKFLVSNTNNNVVYENNKLDSFVDANIYAGFRPNEHWTVFAKGNNLFNETYKNWNNYKVQGFQVLLGAMYKFNFN